MSNNFDNDIDRKHWLESRDVAKQWLRPHVYDAIDGSELVLSLAKTHMELANMLLATAIAMTEDKL